jgi:hypothetical protein
MRTAGQGTGGGEGRKSRDFAMASRRGYRTLKNSASEVDASEQSFDGGQDRAGTVSNRLCDYANKAEIARSFGVSMRTIERWVPLHILPAPVPLGQTARHHLPTITKYLSEQVDLHCSRPSRRHINDRERSV